MIVDCFNGTVQGHGPRGKFYLKPASRISVPVVLNWLFLWGFLIRSAPRRPFTTLHRKGQSVHYPWKMYKKSHIRFNKLKIKQLPTICQTNIFDSFSLMKNFLFRSKCHCTSIPRTQSQEVIIGSGSGLLPFLTSDMTLLNFPKSGLNLRL